MLSMWCNVEDSAFSRGRIASHDKPLMVWLLQLQSEKEDSSSKVKRGLRRAGLPYRYWKTTPNGVLVMVQQCLIRHNMSYDCVTRPTEPNQGRPMTQPLVELSQYRFYSLTGFWPEQFREICSCLVLIPARIKTTSRCVASREEALF